LKPSDDSFSRDEIAIMVAKLTAALWVSNVTKKVF